MLKVRKAYLLLLPSQPLSGFFADQYAYYYELGSCSALQKTRVIKVKGKLLNLIPVGTVNHIMVVDVVAQYVFTARICIDTL